MSANETPQHAVGGAGSPVTLGEEERAIIRDVLHQTGIKPTKEIVERLIDAVQSLMTLFRQADSQRTRLPDRTGQPPGQ